MIMPAEYRAKWRKPDVNRVLLDAGIRSFFVGASRACVMSTRKSEWFYKDSSDKFLPAFYWEIKYCVKGISNIDS